MRYFEGTDQMSGQKSYSAEISDLYISFPHYKTATNDVLKDISLNVTRGEKVCIMGPSGCGKTTLLNALAGFVIPDSGTVRLLGEEIGDSTDTSKYLNYMQQKPKLLPYRNVLENAGLSLELRNGLNKYGLAKVKSLLSVFGLKGFEFHYPHQLSGGMSQRVAFVRTISVETPIYIFDEPFASIDYLTKIDLEEMLWNFLDRDLKTCFMVTHDIESSISFADKVIVLDSNPATLRSEVKLPEGFKELAPTARRESSLFPEQYSRLLEVLNEV
jgi:NitT/TauT family transport system ATP-binding protein